jgi:hypothetical protein
MTMHTHRAISLTAACLAAALTAACTTLDDFKSWTPERRAEHVCGKRSDVQGLREQQRSLEAGINRSQAALTRGYHIHTQCRNVVVQGPLVEKCVVVRSQDNDRDRDRSRDRVKGQEAAPAAPAAPAAIADVELGRDPGRDRPPRKICTLVPSERTVNECIETPVPLVAEVEKEKIQQWTASLAQVRSQEAATYAACVQQVVGMSAEEAYKLR